jgi:hypothetical protein
MAAIAEERAQDLQVLNQHAHQFCAKTLSRLFDYTTRAKIYPDPRYSAQATLCKNDLYAVFQLMIPMFVPPAEGVYSRLRTIEPDLSIVSISNEARAFIQAYQVELARISTLYTPPAEEEENEDDQEDQEEEARVPPIRRLSMSSTQGTNKTLPASQYRGGRRTKRMKRAKKHGRS